MAIIPPPLIPGDKVAIIAPAGNLSNRAHYHIGCSIIGDMGFEIVNREKKWPGLDYLADSDEHRLNEFHKAWADQDVKAIFSLRGGFGSLRLLDKLDMSVISENPKMFVGFSDITILHMSITQETGLIVLHGPVISTLMNSEKDTLERLYHCLTGNWHNSLDEKIEIVRTGPTVKGKLLGGNLSSLISLLGTAWEPDFSESILFLEDINEPIYRLDRLLTQLHLCGKLKNINGIILGNFTMDNDSNMNERLRLHEFVWNRVCELTADIDVPVWGNFPAGHCRKNITLPIGAPAIMDSSTKSLRFSVR